MLSTTVSRHGGADLDDGAAEMRGEHDIGKPGERPRHMGLGLEHVEPGAGDAPFGERRGQRGLVDHRAARRC